MKKQYKTVLGLLGIALILTFAISLSYAYYSVGGKQDLANTFRSGCLNITLEKESDAITINNAIPSKDIEMLGETPYSFTIHNTCSTSTNYSINLESIGDSATSIAPEFIKVALSSSTSDNMISILNSNPLVATFISGAYESHNLYKGTIAGNATKEFKLRLWLDYDATKEAANKVFTSKINVIANPDLVVDDYSEVKLSLQNGNLVGRITGAATSATYCIAKENGCNPTTEVTITNNEITIPWTPSADPQYACVKLNNSKVICSSIYHDVTAPTDPILAFDSNYNLLLSGSTDDQSEVTYFFSTDGTTYTEGNTVPLTESTDVYAYSIDASGNKSNIVRKTVTIANSRTEATPTKYYCSYTNQYYATQSEATNACKEVIDNTYTGSRRYYCSDTGTYQTSSVCDSSYSVAASHSYKCHPQATLSGSTCYATSEISIGQCSASLCNEGYSDNRDGTCTCNYSAPAGDVYTCSSGTLSGTRCIIDDSYTGSVRYYCSDTGTYQTSSTCGSTSTTNHTTNTKYYCSISNAYYDNVSSAESACTNYCATGSYHNNKCFSLN